MQVSAENFGLAIFCNLSSSRSKPIKKTIWSTWKNNKGLPDLYFSSDEAFLDCFWCLFSFVGCTCFFASNEFLLCLLVGPVSVKRWLYFSSTLSFSLTKPNTSYAFATFWMIDLSRGFRSKASSPLKSF